MSAEVTAENKSKYEKVHVDHIAVNNRTSPLLSDYQLEKTRTFCESECWGGSSFSQFLMCSLPDSESKLVCRSSTWDKDPDKMSCHGCGRASFVITLKAVTLMISSYIYMLKLPFRTFN